jgi:hypothetical protein
MNPIESEDVNRHMKELLNRGLIQESLSPCVVPYFLTPNKGGECRICIDLQATNNITIKYQFPLPRMEDLMYFLSGKTYFSKKNLKSGYHNI